MSINRIRLEFKDGLNSYFFSVDVSVLIESDWNLKDLGKRGNKQ